MSPARTPSRPLLLAAAFGLLPLAAHAQISLTSAVALALHSSPRVQLAQDDVHRAIAGLAESRDVYIPTLVGGSGLGYSYGFPLGQPTLFNFQAQSLVFSYSQRDYIRAARASLQAANFTLLDVRQSVTEEAVTTYLALDHDLGRQSTLAQQKDFSARLVQIVSDRVDAGLDTQIDLTTARLSDARIHLALLQAGTETATDQDRLARLLNLPPKTLSTVPSSVPPLNTPDTPDTSNSAAPSSASPTTVESPNLAAAYANLHAKREQAFGDARYLFRPQIAFAADYSRFSSFNNYQQYYARRDAFGNNLPFQYNAAAIGIQITVPVFDAVHRARARQSAADAARAEHEANQLRDQIQLTRRRLERSDAELVTRVEIARLDQQLAQQQLDVLHIQLASPQGSGPQMTPKDEQNARIAEREKYLAYLDARAQLLTARVTLLRQTGLLDAWINSPSAPVSPATITAQPSPVP